MVFSSIPIKQLIIICQLEFRSDYLYEQAVLNKVHPPRPDWYEEFYASVMDSSMKSYEAEVSSV